MDIMIKISSLTIDCKLLETETAKEIYKMLPIKSQINTWGDEIYFDVPTNRIKPDKTANERKSQMFGAPGGIQGGYNPNTILHAL